MKCYFVVNNGLENIAEEELKKLNLSVKPRHYLLEAEVKPEKISLLKNLQSVRRILISLGDYQNLNNLPSDFFPDNSTFKVEVENLKGQENRFKIAREVSQQIIKLNKTLHVDIKKPKLLVIVYFNGKDYFVGLDYAGELNNRDYRVFPHTASFKGDFGYAFVKKSLFKPGEKLLVGFCKDGVIAIEAALSLKNKEKIYVFDENSQNVIAARKNAHLAKVKDFLDIHKFSLDELDVRYDKDFFDRLIFHLTTKDERKINEIYYQANYILKPKGTMLIIGREKFELSISERFNLLKQEDLAKGDNVYKLWLLEKK